MFGAETAAGVDGARRDDDDAGVAAAAGEGADREVEAGEEAAVGDYGIEGNP